MSSKRAKLTADKARERLTGLEESIVAREQKLEQLHSRISRTSSPEAKLLQAKVRLERRIALEREQVQKLKTLLGRRITPSRDESAEFFGSEEIDVLHRSFEEIRQDLSQVKLRLDKSDPGRLGALEERIGRREEADSDLFTQIMNLQTALDQERQTVRILSRRVREQDQNLEALREAVEDSVVATVDIAERMEELEETLNDGTGANDPSPLREAFQADVTLQLSELSERLTELASRPSQNQPVESSPASAEIRLILEALEEFEARIEEMEERSERESVAATQSAESSSAPVPPTTEMPHSAPEVAEVDSTWIPAKFDSQGCRGRVVATFSREPLLRLSSPR
jgi:chromosome segregation ATPase